jgi:GntR family transcriptional repressor for pyruvate dehydrogenase complex
VSFSVPPSEEARVVSSLAVSFSVPPPEELGVLKRVRAETLTERVGNELLDYIQKLGLQPGSLLPGEAVLADQFGVSRPVVREAIRNLAGKGVVESLSGRGTIVRPIDSGPLRWFFDRAMAVGDDDTVIELLEVRQGLEVAGAMLAASRRDDRALAHLRQLMSEMASAVDDEERYADLDVEFHLEVAKTTGNTMMGLLVESIRDALRAGVRRGLELRQSHAQRIQVQTLHEAVLAAIVKGDPNESAMAMAQHFEIAIATVADNLANQAVVSSRSIRRRPVPGPSRGR